MPKTSMKDPKFILIDDEVLSNMISKLMIEKALIKADIQVFTNAQRGLAYIESAYTSDNAMHTILLLDINMPIMNGWEFLDEFEKLPQGIKSCIDVYMLTSSLDPRDQDRSKANPYVKGHFSKPLSREIIDQLLKA